MVVELPSEFQRVIEERLKSGRFDSAVDVIAAALRALEREDSLEEEVEQGIRRAEEQIERGEGRDWTEVREEVRAMFLGGQSK